MNARISIIGGIFDKSAEYRAKHAISPETVLADGLREHGFNVITDGHNSLTSAREFDLVHVHHFGRGAVRVAATAGDTRFIITTHDGLMLCGFPRSWKRRITDGVVLRRADAVIALSNRERDFLIGKFGLQHQRVFVIPNGIHPSFLHRSDTRLADPNGAESILFVGQLREFKGLDFLFEAMRLIHSKFPNTRLRLVYQTDGLLEHYRHLATTLGIADYVDFLGPRSPAELSRLYRESTVFVHPSLGECLSTVILEAMAAGSAIVATDVGGVRDQIDAGSGIIVPPGHAGAIAEAAITLLSNSHLRRSMGTSAQEAAHTRFTVSGMIDQHIELYRQVLRAPRSKTAWPDDLVALSFRSYTGC